MAQATANFQAQLANPAASNESIRQAKADYESAIRSASEVYLAARKSHRDALWNAGLNTSTGSAATAVYNQAQKDYTVSLKPAERDYRQEQLGLIQQYLAPQQELARVKMVALAELQSSLASSNTTATANYAVFVAQATATYNTFQALSTSTQAIALSNAGIDQSKAVASAASQFRQAYLAAEADLTQAQIQALAAWQQGEAEAQEEQALTRAAGERIQVLTVAAAEKTFAFALALAATDWQEATSYASTALGADLKQAGRTLSTALSTAGLDYRTAMTQADAAWSVDQEAAFGSYQEAWLASWIDWQETVVSAQSDAGLFVADALESFRWLEAGAFEFAENERADSAAYLTHLWHLSEATNWSARVEAEAQAWALRTEDAADAVTQYRRSRAEAATAWNLLVPPGAEAGSITQANTVADWSEAQTAPQVGGSSVTANYSAPFAAFWPAAKPRPGPGNCVWPIEKNGSI